MQYYQSVWFVLLAVTDRTGQVKLFKGICHICNIQSTINNTKEINRKFTVEDYEQMFSSADRLISHSDRVLHYFDLSCFFNLCYTLIRVTPDACLLQV